MNRDMRILFLSHTSRNSVFKVGSYHLPREMAKLGHKVAHFSTADSLARRLIKGEDIYRTETAKSGATYAMDNVLDFVPNTVLPTLVLSRRAIKRYLVKLGFQSPDIVFIDQPLLYRRNLFDAKPFLVFRPVDIYDSMQMKMKARILLCDADAVVATSNRVLNDLMIPSQTPVKILSNGVEFSHFVSKENLKRNGVIYVGALDSRFDFNHLRIMASLVRTDFFIYGPMPSSLPSMPENVYFKGPVRYSDLPQILHSAKVGLLPMRHSNSNDGRSPMKFYEFLAAGLNVLASNIAQITDIGNSVRTYSDPYIGATLLSKMLDADENAVGIDLARGQDWQIKTSELLSFITEINSRNIY